MRGLIEPLGGFIFLGGVGLALWGGHRLCGTRWRRVAFLIVAGFLAVVFGLSQLEDDPDDDDPGLAYAIAAFSNLGGWTVGLVGGAAVRRRSRWAAPPGG